MGNLDCTVFAQRPKLSPYKGQIAAKVAELHASDTSNGVMTMRKVDAMDIPANGELTLKPGGYHVMLIGLNRPLVAGEKLPIKLKFEKAGEVTIDAKIKDKGGMGH